MTSGEHVRRASSTGSFHLSSPLCHPLATVDDAEERVAVFVAVARAIIRAISLVGDNKLPRR